MKENLNLIQRAILLVALAYLVNVLTSAFPIKVLGPRMTIVIVIIVVVLQLQQLRVESRDRDKAPSPSRDAEEILKEKSKKRRVGGWFSRMKSGVGLSYKVVIHYLRRPWHFLKIFFAQQCKPYYWQKSLKVALPVVLVTGVAALANAYFSDMPLDNPDQNEQVVHLSHPLWFERDELQIGWRHFGKVQSTIDMPQTALMAVGTDTALIPLEIFKAAAYLNVTPEVLPRNNLTMRLTPAQANGSLHDSFEKLARDFPSVQRDSARAIYSFFIESKTSGADLLFRRYFHFRARSALERAFYAAFLLSFWVFAYLIANGPSIIRTWQEDTTVGMILKKARRLFLRLVENAMHLGASLSKHVQPVQSTLDAIVHLQTSSGKEGEVEKVDTKVKELVQIMSSAEKVTPEIAREARRCIDFMFDVTHEIYFRRILVLETKDEFEFFIHGVVKTGRLVEERCALLENVVSDQDADLQKQCDEINKERERLEKEHNKRKLGRITKIAELLTKQLRKIQENLERAGDPDKGGAATEETDDLENPEIQEWIGGIKGAKIKFKIPQRVSFIVQLEGNHFIFRPEEEKKAIRREQISAPEEGSIEYDLFCEVITFSKDDIRLEQAAKKIKLIPTDSGKKRLKELYAPITVEEMKQRNLEVLSKIDTSKPKS